MSLLLTGSTDEGSSQFQTDLTLVCRPRVKTGGLPLSLTCISAVDPQWVWSVQSRSNWNQVSSLTESVIRASQQFGESGHGCCASMMPCKISHWLTLNAKSDPQASRQTLLATRSGGDSQPQRRDDYQQNKLQDTKTKDISSTSQAWSLYFSVIILSLNRSCLWFTLSVFQLMLLLSVSWLFAGKTLPNLNKDFFTNSQNIKYTVVFIKRKLKETHLKNI